MKTIVGNCFLGVAGFLATVYVAAIAIRTGAADDNILFPYPWVFWLLVGIVVAALAGVVLKNLGKETGPVDLTSGQASVVNNINTKTRGDTANSGNTTFNNYGPTNIAQDSPDPHQLNAPASESPRTSRARIVSSSTGMKYAGLISSRNLRTDVRQVRWISNNAKVGELHPSDRGGGWDAYAENGDLVASRATEQQALEALSKHENRP